jgi:hypothetical protein
MLNKIIIPLDIERNDTFPEFLIRYNNSVASIITNEIKNKTEIIKK